MSNEYASFDPGKRTGIATWTSTGECTQKTVLLPDELELFLEGVRHTRTYKVFIIEDFKLYQHKAQAQVGSKMDAPLAIGKIEMTARACGIQVVKQMASVLKIASMWSGVKKRGAHWPDQDSAYNHGYYYLHRKGIIKARVLND